LLSEKIGSPGQILTIFVDSLAQYSAGSSLGASQFMCSSA
jgi:hypothetical protein